MIVKKGQIVEFPIFFRVNLNGPRTTKIRLYKGMVREIIGNYVVLRGVDVPGLYNRPLEDLRETNA